MGFKFKVGDLVLSKAAIVQQTIQKKTFARVLLVTGCVSVERKDGIFFSYEISGDSCFEADEFDLVGIDGYDPDFTTEQVLAFIEAKESA